MLAELALPLEAIALIACASLLLWSSKNSGNSAVFARIIGLIALVITFIAIVMTGMTSYRQLMRPPMMNQKMMHQDHNRQPGMSNMHQNNQKNMLQNNGQDKRPAKHMNNEGISE